jgi:chromosome segregation ATPase
MPSSHTINFPDDPDPLARYRRETEQQEEELARKHRQEQRERQRNASQVALAADDYWAEIDRRIEQSGEAILKTVGAALDKVIDNLHGSVQVALDRRDDAIEEVRRELEIKLGLGRKLASFKEELAEARQQAPSFKSELEALRAQVARQEKLISRLRGQATELAYAQKLLDADQQKNEREISVTAVQVTAFGQRTEKILRELYESGFNVVEEMQSPSGLSMPSRTGCA